MRLSFLTVAVCMFGGSMVSANDMVSGFNLNPGEKLVAVDGVPVGGLPTGSVQRNGGQTVMPISATYQASGGVMQASAAMPMQSDVRNIEGTLTASGQPFSHTPGETALEKANYERRKNGVGNLIPDPALQQLALEKARIAAARGHKNHIGGSLGGARAEGVGHTQGRFLSCCLDMHATYGGAAMVQGRDGWYCCLLVR
ncbi:MAG TPA: hypothetical protein DDZ51_12975 [Planctomycetaceae bacterium]|nr:hypothetical protein [Planctomycetaceae bacterium]